MTMTNEEKAELEALELEAAEEKKAKGEALARIRLDGLKLRKRLALKHGVHGDDFAVIETWPCGAFGVRRPTEEEAALVESAPSDPETLKGLVLNTIISHPEEEVRAIIVKYPGVRDALANGAFSLVGKLRELEAKK